jgi:3-oxoacyl-[acyl-carrier protein] reductase
MVDPSMPVRAVLVTGAARGLGAAVAARLRDDGLVVVGADLAGSDLELDVRDEQGWVGAARALEQAGEPWGLVNCAARTVVRDLFAIDPEEWDDVLAVNLRGPFLGIRAIGPLLRERGAGRIVNISSDSAFTGRSVIGAHYAASKAALLALTRRAAAALAPHGVTVNAVVPGTIDGESVRELAGDRLDELAAAAALGRLATAGEVAALVAWVVGEESSYVTGTALVADGGAGL